MIHAPTREQLINDNLVKSCLDHIYVRAPNISLSSCVISQRLADHYFVACRFSACPSLSVSRPSEGEVKHDKIRISIINQRNLDDLITGFDWLTLIEHNPPEKVYEKFCEQLTIFEKLSQGVMVKKRRRNYNWLNGDVIHAMTYRDCLLKRSKRAPNDKVLALEYKVERNRVVALIRVTKRRYFLQQFSQSARNAAK
ncbi:unnamed protein product, partial [Ixodes hexagonus]